MSPRQLALAVQRERLLVRSATLREHVATHSAALAPALAVADTVRNTVFWLRAHPLAVVSALLAIAVLRPRKAWRWGMRAWSAWQFVNRWRRRLGTWVSSHSDIALH